MLSVVYMIDKMYIPRFVSTVVIIGLIFFSITPFISYYGEFYELIIEFKKLNVKMINFGGECFMITQLTQMIITTLV